MAAQADELARLPLDAFVERLIAPFGEFMERTPSYFALASQAVGQRLPKDAAVDAAMRESLRAALGRRSPEVAPEEIAIRVDVIHAIGDGIAPLMVRAAPAARPRLVAELKRAVYGYLAAFESRPGVV